MTSVAQTTWGAGSPSCHPAQDLHFRVLSDPRLNLLKPLQTRLIN